MARYILLRIGQALLVTWVAYTLAFFLLFALPSDPVSLLLGPDATDISAEERAVLAAQYGFDKPLVVQYATAFFNLLRGDLGYSIQMSSPVGSILAEAIGYTAQLAALGFLFALIFGIGIAVIASYAQNSWLRQALLSLPSLAVSIPAFWFGLLLIQIFSFRLQLFPAFSAEGLSSMILPALTLALPTSAMIAQVFTRSLNVAINEAYSATAFAKGTPRFAVVIRHALPNALLPMLTITGLVVGQLLSGAVVTETVFSRPGLGRVIASAVSQQDIPVVLGAVLVGAALYSITNLIVDLLYPLVDPRQRARFAKQSRIKKAEVSPAPELKTRKDKDHDNADSTVEYSV